MIAVVMQTDEWYPVYQPALAGHGTHQVLTLLDEDLVRRHNAARAAFRAVQAELEAAVTAQRQAEERERRRLHRERELAANLRHRQAYNARKARAQKGTP